MMFFEDDYCKHLIIEGCCDFNPEEEIMNIDCRKCKHFESSENNEDCGEYGDEGN